jgi:beta-1,4-N-acetylglucosaminyltransferase
MKSKNQTDILLVSSTGGHFAQLKEIAASITSERFSILTEKNKTTEGLDKKYNIYYIAQQDRKKKDFALVMLYNWLMSFVFLLKINPKVIISTGAGATLPTLILGKLLRKKIIYVESFAKIHSPTLTGKIVYRFADSFYVQWEPMLEHYPKAKFKGAIY